MVDYNDGSNVFFDAIARYAAAIRRHNHGGGDAVLLKQMSMYSSGGTQGRPGLGEKEHGGEYFGTWKMQALWGSGGGGGGGSGGSGGGVKNGGVMLDDDIGSW